MVSFLTKQLNPKILNSYKVTSVSILLICITLNAGCLSDEKYYPFQGELREFIHQNGLTVKLPETLVATENDKGFLIEPAGDLNKHLRNQLMVWIEKRENERPDAFANLRQKTVGNRTLNYQIELREGGSGGDEYRFTAWEKNERDFIVYKQVQQSEYGEPNFATCWQIIEKTAIKK